MRWSRLVGAWSLLLVAPLARGAAPPGRTPLDFDEPDSTPAPPRRPVPPVPQASDPEHPSKQPGRPLLPPAGAAQTPLPSPTTGALPNATAVAASPGAQALIDRPLLLPAGRVRLDLGLAVTRRASATEDVGVGEALSLAVSAGLTRSLEGGLWAELPVGPQAHLGGLLANLTVRLAAPLALRLDAGLQESQRSLAGPSQAIFVGGVGLPIRARLRPRLAFISGTPRARGFGPQPLLVVRPPLGVRATALYGENAGVLFSEDLLAVGISPGDGDNPGSSQLLALTAPLGLLIQAHPRLALAARTGVRVLVLAGGGASRSSYHLPLAADITVRLADFLELGATASLAGYLGGNLLAGARFTDISQFDFWLAATL